MNINIVIPVLNEERVLEKNIIATIKYLDSTELEKKYVITIADNGSTDKTLEIAKKLSELHACIKWIKVEEKGVGLAFRKAIKCNSSEIVGYMDIDLATDIRHLLEVYKAFSKANQNIVIGSRLLPDSKVYGRSLKREITSRGLNILLHLVLHTKISDAMCGFKFYKKEVADHLVKKCSENVGWFYCAEMLIQAEWDNIKIKELPVQWHDDDDSKVDVGKLSMNYLKDIKQLYRDQNRRKL